ncbi:MAG: hypothetical protein O7E51_10810 [Acidobacteria bacterium]|nr:hypothetical protein [Acidobacteriota bacterium]
MTMRTPEINIPPLLSALTVKNASIPIVGVPLSVPEADRVSPGGGWPPVIEKVKGVGTSLTLSVTTSVNEYGSPTTPSGASL